MLTQYILCFIYRKISCYLEDLLALKYSQSSKLTAGLSDELLYTRIG